MGRLAAQGTTLVWALVALVAVGGISAAGVMSLRSTTQHVEVRFRKESQALDVARAGLIDAFAWFRRQQNQPPSEFAPRRDLTVSPVIDETDDPDIGLVREFEISAGYYGRYEVRRFEDRDGDGIHDSGEGVRDVTTERGLTGSGAVWVIESRGYVYRHVDPNAAWNEDPNYRVAGAVVTSEIRSFTIVPPGAAAICASAGNRVSIADGTFIFATNSTGIVFPLSDTTTTSPTVASGAEIQADVDYAPLPDYDDSLQAVFGATRGRLLEMSTIRLRAGDSLPATLPDYAFVFCEGDLVVTAEAPLTGVGLLIVDGDLTLEAGSASFFTGVVYVTGNYVQAAPSHVRGTIIAQGTVKVAGAGDISEIAYDPEVIGLLNGNIGPFRLSRGVRRMDSAGVGGDNASRIR